jgi:hypothetical protein
MRRTLIGTCFLLLLCTTPSPSRVSGQQTSHNTIGRDIFVRPNLGSHEGLTDWTLDGSGSWDISDGKLILVKAGQPSGPIRRPAALAILKTEPLRRVTLQAQMKSTAPIEVVRRDVVLVFGYESPTRFYYVHLSATTDAVHNGIFLVADADRRRIDDGKGEPKLKDQSWHRIRLVRDGSTGRIEVFVDDSTAPVLSAIDSTIRTGRIGLGSFDDTGEFRDITVTGSAK